MISPRYLFAAVLVAIAPSVISSADTDASCDSELPEWKGATFKDSNPGFAYETGKPDLSDIPMTKNLDNIHKITRMQKIIWPEFSWLSEIGNEASCVYATFAQDVSRIGYDDDGRIWSFVCPQRGIPLSILGTAFIEVTVTGIRGWIDEETHSCYADVSVIGNLWIEPALGNPLVQALKRIFDNHLPGVPFPFSKKNAVKVDAFQVGKPWEKVWPMANGTDPTIFQPLSKRHYDDDAFSAYHLQVEMGKRINKGISLVDKFDEMLLGLFNMASGNILAEGSLVAWNVWPTAPEVVDRKEWEGHADLWFHSMNIKHEYPDGKSLFDRTVAYADGTEFEADLDIRKAAALVKRFVAEAKELLDGETAKEMVKDPVINFMTNHLLERRVDHIKDRVVDRIKDRVVDRIKN